MWVFSDREIAPQISHCSILIGFCSRGHPSNVSAFDKRGFRPRFGGRVSSVCGQESAKIVEDSFVLFAPPLRVGSILVDDEWSRNVELAEGVCSLECSCLKLVSCQSDSVYVSSGSGSGASS